MELVYMSENWHDFYFCSVVPRSVYGVKKVIWSFPPVGRRREPNYHRWFKLDVDGVLRPLARVGLCSRVIGAQLSLTVWLEFLVDTKIDFEINEQKLVI